MIIFIFSLNAEGINIILPKAPPSLPMVKTASKLEGINLIYYTDAMVEAVPNIIKNKEYLYVIPINMGAKLYEKNQDLKLIGILSKGLLSVISEKNYVSIKDLDNNEIYIGGQGSSPDVISRYIFNKNNINPKIKYRSSQEIAKLMISKKAHNAVLPEPLASLVLDKNKNLKRSFIFKDLWNDVSNSDNIPQVGLFAPKKMLDKNKDKINELLLEYKKSVNWVNSNTDEAADLASDIFQIKISKELLKESIKNMNLVYISGKDGRSEVKKYLENLKETNNDIVKRMPDEDFYQE